MTRKKKSPYLNNKDLLKQVIISKEQEKMSDELANMMMMLVKKYAKSPQFSGYSYREDMESFALMMLCHTWHKFNPERSNNPFAFFTTCVRNSFVHTLKQEKRHRNIRDEVLISNNLQPSHTYMLESEERNRQSKLLAEEIQHPDPPKEKKPEPLYE